MTGVLVAEENTQSSGEGQWKTEAEMGATQATSQGPFATTGSWKRQGSLLSWILLREYSPTDIWILAPALQNKFLLF